MQSQSVVIPVIISKELILLLHASHAKRSKA